MSTHYFATDGSYGDATDLLVVHTDDWSESDWDKVLDCTDADRLSVVREICDSQQNNVRLLGL